MSSIVIFHPVLEYEMKICLPTQPNQPQPWVEGAIPPLRLATEPEQKPNRPPPVPTIHVVEPAPRRRGWGQIAILVCLVLLSIASYQIVTHYIMTAVVIEGRSMAPTLQEGDRFLLDRWSYRYRSPERGDLVVIKDPGHQDYAVKRIVGLPGETLFLRDGAVLLNGKHLVETYLTPGTRTFCSDMKDRLIMVGNDQYFVLGDNRANSEDSRFYGTVPRERIIGMITR